MQEHEVRALFERLRAAMDPAVEYAERRLQETFPGGEPPRIQLRRLTGGGDVWFGESIIHYPDGTVVHGVSRVEFRDGKMWRETRYYAEPFEVPAWRAAWSKPVAEEPVAVG